MSEKDPKSLRVLFPGRVSPPALTLDEEWILSAQLIAAEARGPLRPAGLEEIVAARDEEARLNRRRRLIQFVIVLTVFLFLA